VTFLFLATGMVFFDFTVNGYSKHGCALGKMKKKKKTLDRKILL